MKHILASISAICLITLAASCTAPEDFQRETEARCTELGYQAGTPDFANCVQTNHARGHRACQNCLPGAQW
jgi:hypothetical protein